MTALPAMLLMNALPAGESIYFGTVYPLGASDPLSRLRADGR